MTTPPASRAPSTSDTAASRTRTRPDYLLGGVRCNAGWAHVCTHRDHLDFLACPDKPSSSSMYTPDDQISGLLAGFDELQETMGTAAPNRFITRTLVDRNQRGLCSRKSRYVNSNIKRKWEFNRWANKLFFQFSIVFTEHILIFCFCRFTRFVKFTNVNFTNYNNWSWSILRSYDLRSKRNVFNLRCTRVFCLITRECLIEKSRKEK